MLFKLCFLSLFVYFSSATRADPTKSYDISYSKAVQAYLEENWEQCILHMNEAIDDYHFYTDAVVGCRMECHKEALGNTLISPQLEDMKLWERLIRQTLCILKCKKSILKDRAEIVDRKVMYDFETFMPYDYLQLCYYKVNDILKAASCAYTFLTMNQNHTVMKDNLRYYINEMKIDPNFVMNLEAKPYVEFHIRGSEAYKNKDFGKVASYMELSVVEYLQAEEECRAQCEGPFDQGWFPDFISSISNHYTFTLRCKQKCSEKLGNLNGEINKDLFASHYHYLQFAYFKLGDVYKASQATASYLLFFPNDETMLENKAFYLSLGVVSPDSFQPRPEAVRYLQRDQGEKALIRYIEESFHFEEGDITEAAGPEVNIQTNEIEESGRLDLNNTITDEVSQSITDGTDNSVTVPLDETSQATDDEKQSIKEETDKSVVVSLDETGKVATVIEVNAENNEILTN